MRALLSLPLGNPASGFKVADLIWLIPTAAFMGFALVMAWASEAAFISTGGF